MVHEASLADLENIKIKSEFSTRETQTNLLIKQQEQSLQKLKDVNIENSLTESSVEHQNAQIRKILAANNELNM